ncbi:MAG: type II CAAX endopeptidase family protein [Verrucomicrobiota bacterium]
MTDSGGKINQLRWWCLVFASVVLIIKPPWQDWAPEATATGDERVTLAVLELQGRILIGAASFSSEDMERQLAEMEVWAVGDRTAIAVAAIRFFLDPEGNGKWRALALVKARLKKIEQAEEPAQSSNKELLQQAHIALEHPDQLGDEGEQLIRSQMGWFGSILISAGAAEGEVGVQEAADLRAQAVSMVFVSSFLFLVVFLGALLGLGLLVAALLAMKHGKLTMVGVSEEIPATPFLAAFALYLAVMVLADFLSLTVHPMLSIGGMFVSIGLAFFWPRIRGLSWKQVLHGFGWRRGKGIVREMGAGVVGYMAMAPVFALGFATTLILTLLSTWLASHGSDPEAVTEPVGHPVTHPVVAWVAEGDWKVKLGVLFLASGLAPLFEETMFRGALYGVFRKRWGFVLSSLASGFIFAVIHPQGWVAIPALTAMGFGFAIIREWRGTLIASMTAHSVHNGILVSMLLLAMS